MIWKKLTRHQLVFCRVNFILNQEQNLIPWNCFTKTQSFVQLITLANSMWKLQVSRNKHTRLCSRLTILNPLSGNHTEWSNTPKQIIGNLPTNCLSVFDHFGGLVLKGLMSRTKKTLVWLLSVFTLLKGLLHAKLLRHYKLWNFK